MNTTLIRLARHFSGLSQRELATMLGQSQVAVSRYEHGKLTPSPDTMRLLKKIFQEHGVGIAEIHFLNENFSTR